MPSPLGKPFAPIAFVGVFSALAGCEGCTKPGATADATADAANSNPGIIAVDASQKLPEGGAVSATPIPIASVNAMLNPEKLPAYAGPTGSVEGNITVIGDPPLPTAEDFARCPDAAKTWGRAFREGEPDAKGERPLADAIVVVTGYHGFHLEAKQEAVTTRIEDCAYTTRTLTLTFGQRLEVKNLTKDFWTPVLEPQRNIVVMMAPPNGDAVRIYPKAPGHLLLLDRDRKYAVVDVYAFLHPLHASTSTTGYYRIDGLPVGKVKIGTTHPRIDASAETELTVGAGVVHKVDLVLKNVNKEGGAPMDAGPDAKAAPPLR